MNKHQQHVIEYLIEENRVLREQIGNRRMRFSDNQRRRLAAKAKKLGRKLLAHVATIVSLLNGRISNLCASEKHDKANTFSLHRAQVDNAFVAEDNYAAQSRLSPKCVLHRRIDST